MLEILGDEFGLYVDAIRTRRASLAFLAMVLAAVLASALYPALLARRPADLRSPRRE